MISLMRNRVLALVVTIHMIGLATSPAWAALIPSKTSPQGTESIQVQQDMEKVQLALENKLVQEKLRANGLSPEEVKARLGSMTPAQIHLLAQASDDVLAGGDGLGTVIAVLIIVILFIVILKLLNKEIIIRMSALEDPASALYAPVG
ncbi:MAG TPA: PA2779 family protein [Deltaproteobacteria bacterium]|nr:PA2779 family protein [Deltaproteobacteria bacterium]HOI06976.1 PA2779 family protein [Deltaproteobacteria bacterium]